MRSWPGWHGGGLSTHREHIGGQSGHPRCNACCEQVKEVAGQDVVCTAVNDAELDGLLTVIHSERGGDGMSSLQVRRTSNSRLHPSMAQQMLLQISSKLVTGNLYNPSRLRLSGLLKHECGWLQTDLPLLTDLDEDAIKTFTKEFEVNFLFSLSSCLALCKLVAVIQGPCSTRCRSKQGGCQLLQIDYINLTYTCSGLDVHEMRDFLDDIGATQVKIIAKVSPASPHVPVNCVTCLPCIIAAS